MATWDLLGITKNEYRVYLALLKHGATTISGLSSLVKLNERSTYDYIERLIHKGLVGQILSGNKRTFLGLNPDMLTFHIDEEEQAIESEFNALQKMSEEVARDVLLNLISSKTEFLKLIRSISSPTSAFIGRGSDEFIKTHQFKYFISHNDVKIRLIHNETSSLNTQAEIAAIFHDNCFIIFSFKEEKGFFIDDKDFSENMKVYFNAAQ